MTIDLTIFRENEIATALDALQSEVLDTVAQTYRLHDAGETVVPLSQFLRPNGETRDRYIALSASIGGPQPVTGVKFVSSYPGNRASGIPRAAAIISLHDPMTGVPKAVLEGAAISAARTAGSAAVAAFTLVDVIPRTVGFLGAGRINRATASYLDQRWPGVPHLVYDPVAERVGGARWTPGSQGACLDADVVCFATDAVTPTAPFDWRFRPDQTVLHLSLRDLTVEQVAEAWNVVDDPDHVLREATSLHRAVDAGYAAERLIAGTLGNVLAGGPGRDPAGARPVVFSPFGLGALDVAVARLVLDYLTVRGLGHVVRDFIAATA